MTAARIPIDKHGVHARSVLRVPDVATSHRETSGDHASGVSSQSQSRARVAAT